MKIQFGRIVVAAIAVEVLAIAVLVIIVTVFGPSSQAAAEEYAQKMGYWVGPIAGIVFCAIGGWGVTRQLNTSHVINGFLVGLLVATVDVSLLLLADVEYQNVFLVSNIGKVVAGTFGGWIAGKGAG